MDVYICFLIFYGFDRFVGYGIYVYRKNCYRLVIIIIKKNWNVISYMCWCKFINFFYVEKYGNKKIVCMCVISYKLRRFDS